MVIRKIEIHIQALASLLERDKADFSDFRSFNDYQKQQIKAYRDHLLANKLKCLTTDLQFSKHEYGKPFLSSHTLEFNHSHSQKYYALAMSERVKEIGVDVEELDRKVRLMLWLNMPFILKNIKHGCNKIKTQSIGSKYGRLRKQF